MIRFAIPRACLILSLFFSTLGLTLILAGGVGNVVDRVAFGWVTDFLNFGVGSIRTGIFNVADMAVVLGCLLLFKTSLRLA